MKLSFSIIIPTYSRPKQLKKCLNFIEKLDYPKEQFEAIVVDDGSKAPLDDVVKPFQQNMKLRLIRQVNAGPAKARNTGAAAASGDYLAFTDDDCMPLPDWLERLNARFIDAPDCLVGGQTLNSLEGNLYSSSSQILCDYIYTCFNSDANKSSFFASNNFALSKNRFIEIGGFNTTYPRVASEDRELCNRWLSNGNKLIYAEEVKILHAHELNLLSFWQQHFFYGRGAYFFHQIRQKYNQEKLKIEPFRFYKDMLCYPFKKYKGWDALKKSFLLGVSQVAHTMGYFRQALLR